MVLPTLLPALLTGFALAFARAVGEYGSVIFIAGNLPMVSEITPLIIITKLEQYDYAGATAVAVGDAGGLVRAAAHHQRPAGLDRRRSREGALMAASRTARAALRSGAARFEANTGDARSAAGSRRSCCRCRSASSRLFLLLPLVAVFVEALRKGWERLPRSAGRARRALGHPADAADGGDRRAAQPRVRHRGRLGHHQVRFPRQAVADHASSTCRSRSRRWSPA